MTALEEIKKAIEDIGPLKVELLLETIEGNAIISPTDDYCGTYFTIIGCGDKQNELGTLIWLAVNKMPELVSTIESLQRENERLQAEIDRKSSMPGDHRYWEGRYRDEAAENELLRSVLRPMAGVAGDVSESWPDDAQVVTEIGHFRRARQALASTGGEHNAE